MRQKISLVAKLGAVLVALALVVLGDYEKATFFAVVAVLCHLEVAA